MYVYMHICLYIRMYVCMCMQDSCMYEYVSASVRLYVSRHVLSYVWLIHPKLGAYEPNNCIRFM